MNKRICNLSGTWSATPTPLTDSLRIDHIALKRTVKHHIDLGVKGIFLAGNCGEGPYLNRSEVRRLVAGAAEAGNGKIVISVQVTDNSFTKVLEHISDAKKDGADIAILAAPWFCHPMRDPNVLEDYYYKAAEKSSLPLGIYLWDPAPPLSLLRKVFMHPNVCIVKNSCASEDVVKLSQQILKKRPDLAVMTGVEFGMDNLLKAGFSGVVAGGGILIAKLITEMIDLAKQGQFEKLNAVDKHCSKILWAAYGGRKLGSWLTGLKHALVKMGIFRSPASYLTYPLPKSVIKRIDKMLEDEKDVLLPS